MKFGGKQKIIRKYVLHVFTFLAYSVYE